MEKEKWDRYYAALPVTQAEEGPQKFNAQLLTCISELLPAGSRILEAGCGGGWQSLELARSGRYKVSLMDFSQNALTYAKQLFEREELCAELIHGDVVEPGEPEFDLVFNSGVLEHYRVEEQAAFLRGMASRSRNLVLVLVPNRQCYWYWLSRVERSSKQLWPFGKEVPLTDLSSAFEVAGLQYLGRTYMGEAWTEVFVNNLPGIADELREVILAIHRSPLIVKEQRCYLMAALGSVTREAFSVPARTWEANIASRSKRLRLYDSGTSPNGSRSRPGKITLYEESFPKGRSFINMNAKLNNTSKSAALRRTRKSRGLFSISFFIRAERRAGVIPARRRSASPKLLHQFLRHIPRCRPQRIGREDRLDHVFEQSR